MENTLKKRFWKVAFWFISGFFVLFISSIVYHVYFDNSDERYSSYGGYFTHIENLTKNYASDQAKSFKLSTEKLSIPSINQVYEKIASVSSKTSQFDQDTKALRHKIGAYNGIIQYEKLTGEIGDQEVHLVIGVKPNLFDKFYNDILKIGKVEQKEIVRTDKTSEYEQINAQKTSMEEQLQSLYELKEQAKQIQEFITLNGRIFEIKERLRMLGVDLTKFDAENEFCTVRVSLYEGDLEQKVNYTYKINMAFQWSSELYVKGVGAVLGTVLTVLVIMYLIDKLRGVFGQK